MATAVPASQLFASLLRYDDEWNPQPYLATDWEWVDDGLGLQLSLQENAVFHDGEPITSEDVAFSIMAAKANHPFKSMFEAVESVETPDPHTAVLRLRRSYPGLLIALSPDPRPRLRSHIDDLGQEFHEHAHDADDVLRSRPLKYTSLAPAKGIMPERIDDFFIEGGKPPTNRQRSKWGDYTVALKRCVLFR